MIGRKYWVDLTLAYNVEKKYKSMRKWLTTNDKLQASGSCLLISELSCGTLASEFLRDALALSGFWFIL